MTQRTAIITGGSSGIGLAIARQLAQQDYRVAIVARDPQRLQQAAQQIGPDTRYYSADLSRRGPVEDVVAQLAADLGTVDVLINNAGFTRVIAADTPLAQAEQEWDAVIEGNLKSTFLFTLAMLPHLRKPGGHIINLSSIAAQCGSGSAGALGYSAAKAGVQGFTLSLARELGELGITVNAIAPGFIADTRFFGAGLPQDRIDAIAAETPMGRTGRVEDIASAALWLASKEASFVTGTITSINGGARVG
ncbi:SDR family NAD(P)-dependent oxidoreductase [Serratia proteamaculans]|uniref:SDR family NAD(P)-dependent oxidoreductase n=1 Tax=Serratia proteamaculans TaxID=28151 RepID=UPI003CFF0EB2